MSYKLLRDILLSALSVVLGMLLYELFLRQWIGKLRMGIVKRG